MPRFLIAIHEYEAGYAREEPSVRSGLWRRHDKFVAALAPLGIQVLWSEALGPQSAAVQLRTDGPRPALINDPLPRKAPRLGGFYLIEATDFDAAVEAAGMCPAEHGYVEVRPVALAAT